MYRNDGISERICDVCGKNVAYTCDLEQWTYKIMRKKKMIFCCSYSCYKEEKKKIRKYNVVKKG